MQQTTDRRGPIDRWRARMGLVAGLAVAACGGGTETSGGRPSSGGAGGTLDLPSSSASGEGGTAAVGGAGGTGGTGGIGGAGGGGGAEAVPCEDRALPSSWNRLTEGPNGCSYRYGSAGNWLDPADDCRWFGKTEAHNGVWPWSWEEQTSFQKVLGVPSTEGGRHYIALEFDSGASPTIERQLSLNIPQSSNLVNARKLISISRCPGDFDAAAIEAEMGPGCVIGTFVGNPNWGGPSFREDPFSCGLEPDTRYYLNIVFSDSPVGTAPADIEPNCTHEWGCGSRFTPNGG